MIFDDFLETPLIVVPGMEPQELRYETEQMLLRSQAAADLLAGRIDPETYLDLIAEHGYDPSLLVRHWESICPSLHLDFQI